MHGSSRKLIIGALVLIVAAVLYWKFHPGQRAGDEAYVAEPTVTVWSTTAQVRQTAAELHWGERVAVSAEEVVPARRRAPEVSARIQHTEHVGQRAAGILVRLRRE